MNGPFDEETAFALQLSLDASAHCSWLSLEEKEHIPTVGRIFPRATSAYVDGLDFPALQLGRIKRHFNWGIAEGEPFVIALPHLVLHCSTEFYTRDVMAENLYLKRKCSVLEEEHAEMKQKHAKLEHDVEHLKRLVSQLLASSSLGLTIADQGGESTASDVGASDAKGKKKI